MKTVAYGIYTLCFVIVASCLQRPAFAFEIKPVIDHKVYRSAEPYLLEEYLDVITTGVTIVIDLENESGEAKRELKRWSQIDEDITFYSVPMSGFFAPSHKQVRDLIKIIDNAITMDQVVLIHCKHGEDRTGLIAALVLREETKMTKREGWKYMIENGFHRMLLGLTWFYWAET